MAKPNDGPDVVARQAAAKTIARRASDDLLDVARGKHAAAVLPAGRDTNKVNAERVKREGWSKTDGPDHRSTPARER